jgi:hypothetical protein
MNLIKFKIIEITQCLLSGHSKIKPEINNKKKDSWKILKSLEMKQHTLNNTWGKG